MNKFSHTLQIYPHDQHLCCRHLLVLDPASFWRSWSLGDEPQSTQGGGVPMVRLAADWGRFCSSQQSTAAAAAPHGFGLALDSVMTSQEQ